MNQFAVEADHRSLARLRRIEKSCAAERVFLKTRTRNSRFKIQDSSFKLSITLALQTQTSRFTLALQTQTSRFTLALQTQTSRFALALQTQTSRFTLQTQTSRFTLALQTQTFYLD